MAEKKSVEELQREQLELTNANLRLQNENAQLQAEELRDSLAQRKAVRAQRRMSHNEQEKTLAQGRAADVARWKACTHRKGGKGDQLVKNRGNDANYSIVRHTYAFGNTNVLCTRCFCEWKPGDTEKTHSTGISWETAMQWPTDNSDSVAVQFRYPQQPIADERLTRVPVEG